MRRGLWYYSMPLQQYSIDCSTTASGGVLAIVHDIAFVLLSHLQGLDEADEGYSVEAAAYGDLQKAARADRILYTRVYGFGRSASLPISTETIPRDLFASFCLNSWMESVRIERRRRHPQLKENTERGSSRPRSLLTYSQISTGRP